MFWRSILRICLLLAALLPPAAGVLTTGVLAAGPGGPVAPPGDDLVRARLVAEDGAVAPGRPFWVLLHLEMKPGWHTYWRNPGDSGLPTTIDWTLPAGFSAGDIVWPAPERFQIGPIANYGYGGTADLLVPITPPADLPAGAPVALKAEASWLVCADICIPGGTTLDLGLPAAATAAPDPANAALFAAARARVPVPAPFEAVFSASADGYRLRLPAGATAGLNAPRATFFPYDGELIDHSAAPQSIRTSSGVELRLPKGGVAKPAPATLDGVVVVEAEGAPARAFAVSANPAPAGAAADDPASGGAASQAELPVWWQALLLAVLGGIVLNIMPCVFPILSMKALALAQQAGHERAAARRHGRAYLAGVLASFAALGGLLLALRSGGAVIGWGFQLQSPAFVALLAYLLFALGLTMSGVLHVGGRFAGLGSSLATRGGLAGAFFTGVLATVVATPCTAPFMGAALGAAIVAPPAVGMAIFLALGLGLALPLWLMSEVPWLARLLPRPGAWMETFKQFLAFPLYGSAAWLLWVLLQQVDPQDGLAALGGLVVVGFACWLYGVSRDATRPAIRRAAVAIVTVAALAAIALALQTSPGQASRPQAAEGRLDWQAFSTDRIAELQADKRPVLVNLTAAWCLTCLVNERTALETEAVRDALAAKGVVALKGDWTRQDPQITAFLQRFGRSGVPLYVLYDRRGGSTVLPQILTTASLVEAISKL